MVKLYAPAFMAQISQTQAQAGWMICGIMLAIDTLNPIKIMAWSLRMDQRLFAVPFTIMLVSLIATQFADIMYFSVRIFFSSIISIFFNKVDIIGQSNVPAEGPIIFTGNHANQFVDALQVITACGHKVGWLIAKKSWDRKVPGFFARAMSCIPVVRPQDSAIKRPSTETIVANGDMITGINTKFTELFKDRDKLRFRGKSEQFKVEAVVSDTSIKLGEAVPQDYVGMGPSAFDVLKYVDQGKVFGRVHIALAHGKCLGIFPEGGSHDRTDLLPLKAGVAVIAFGTLEKHGVNVPVVPIGLNYFRGHRFRARAVVEFGPPVRISEELHELYKTDKKEAYSQFLMQIEEAMRGCIITAPDYDSLQLVYTARRLWQSDDVMPPPEQKQDMNRRFAESYKILAQKYSEEGMPQEATELKERLESYRQSLGKLGMRDYQVRTLDKPNPLKATYTVIHMLVVLLLASVPSFILNLPVGVVARVTAIKERKKALAGSVVKIAGRDVMLSKKIMISIVMVPLLWMFYAVLMMALTDWEFSTKVLVMLCFPLFSYAGVVGTASGMVDLKDIKPLLNMLRPSTRTLMNELPAVRRELQKDLRAFIKKVGPELGEIYTKPDLKWGDLFRMQKDSAAEAEGIQKMAANAAEAMGDLPNPKKND
ncbi:unnamed protein product [Ectocarpus sp. 6 AP-2014]|uniref:Phospholipid/glycerol acyltransferase domain-containing protein n=1 Tax=Ectocarpus siliculosus TaxID=2880 RepID=D7G464_ECTSI|nr:conserved unknown protein [Ectocarpus siliculosus]|eukprot:CBJ27079.1 conserved unknown protein [Ectocarpus siliculosus]